MTCENSPDIAFEFRDNDGTVFLKIRPLTMTFERTRSEFAYCSAKFSEEVADHLNGMVRPKENRLVDVLSTDDEQPPEYLQNPLPVLLYLDGDAIARLMYVPAGVRFGKHNVHIEFHDLQKYLTKGKIDIRSEHIKLRNAYEWVFRKRDTSGPQIFKDEIKFTVPDEAYEELISLWTPSGNQRNRASEALKNEGGRVEERIRKHEEENINNIIEGEYAIDFDKISPWEAIQRLNKKFGVTTWATPSGHLAVGSRSSTGYKHVAATDDNRVWKLLDYNVTAPRDPVVKSVVRGGWAGDPGEKWDDQASEITNLNRGSGDFRVEGVAERENVRFGQDVVSEVEESKKSALKSLAKRQLLAKQREQWSGTINILPRASGQEYSNIRYVNVGDRIFTVPPKDNSVCDTNITADWFDIVGVTHSLKDNGNWTVQLEITPVLDGRRSPEHIDTSIRYYDPFNKETITEDQYSARGEDNGWWPVW